MKVSDAYQAWTKTPEGRTVLLDLILQGGLLATSVVEGDPAMTAYHEGRRSIVLHILDRMGYTAGPAAEAVIYGLLHVPNQTKEG